MPTRINGCGTWYYTRSNVHSRQGVCSSCSRSTTLSSYDTRLFVTLLFIPVIPISRLRIIDQCSACRRHGVLSWAKWQEAMQGGKEAVAAYLRAPVNRDLAADALHSCMAFRDREAFVPLMKQIEKSLPRDVAIMGLTGAACVLFNMLDDAERVLRLSLQLNDNDGTSEALAGVLVKLGRPTEAEPYLEHVVTRRAADRVGNLLALAQGYQAGGQHDQALRVFGQCDELAPRLLQDKAYIKLKSASTKRLGTGKPVKARQPFRAGMRESRGLMTRVLPVGLVVGAIAYFAVSIYKGSHEKVYLVSGMHQPYTVTINGINYDLQPGSQQEVELRDGVNHLHFVDPALPLADEDFTTHISFWTRPFSSTAVVVNPDMSAVLDREAVFYRPEGMPGKDSEPEFHTGELVHHYEGIDYDFVDPPQSIDMGNSSEIRKEALHFVDLKDRTTPSVMVALKSDNKLSGNALTAAMRRRVALAPEDVESRRILEEDLSPAEIMSLLKSGLTHRPLLTQWHREYQELKLADGANDELIKEYQALLAKEPADADLMYLLSRVTKDPDEALALLLRSTSAEHPSAFGNYSLGGAMLESGKFTEAVDLARKAIQLRPDVTEFVPQRDQALMAAGRAREVLDRMSKDESGPVLTALSAYETELNCYALLNDRANADAVCRKFADRAKQEKASVLEELAATLPADVSYMFGDPAGLKAIINATSEPDEKFTVEVSTGAVVEAEKELQQMPQATANAYLELYLAAVHAGNTETAERSMKAAIDKLGKGSFEDQQFAAALGGKSAMPLEKLMELRRPIQEKVVMMTALSLRQPATRETTFALSKKLNFIPRFPKLLVQTALAGN